MANQRAIQWFLKPPSWFLLSQQRPITTVTPPIASSRKLFPLRVQIKKQMGVGMKSLEQFSAFSHTLHYQHPPQNVVSQANAIRKKELSGSSRISVEAPLPDILDNDSKDAHPTFSRYDEEDEQAKAKEIMESLTMEDTESFPRVQKPFVDLTWIECKAGNGGNPKANSLRSPSLRGCGYGGHGGNIILQSSHLYEDFLHLDQKVRARHGGDGHDTSRGLHGKDLVMQVPIGTIVRKRVPTEAYTTEGRRLHQKIFWYQFLQGNEKLNVATGGRGGVAPSSHRKKDGRLGEPGEKTLLELELRLLNDAAIVGYPNSGKTALLSAMTRYHTRIGPEPFSTTRPHVGVLRFNDGVNVRIMDLPGFSEGAHSDKSKGRRILRHLYRSKAIVYTIDASSADEELDRDMLTELLVLRNEIAQYDAAYTEKVEMVVATKCDMLHKDTLYNLDSLFYRLRARFPDIHVVGTSARFGLGIQRTVNMIRQLLYPDMLILPRRTAGHPTETISLPNDKTKIESLQRLKLEALPHNIPPPNSDE